jgi:hypothetical protein
VLPFWGYFFNDPTKSSLIGEKSPKLVTLVATGRRHEILLKQVMLHGYICLSTSLLPCLLPGLRPFSKIISPQKNFKRGQIL